MATTPLLIDGRAASSQLHMPDNAVATWAAMGAGDSGEAFSYSAHGDRSVQITGTFGGTTVTIEGSNDGTSWFVLTDPANAAISKTSAALVAITEATRYIRPKATGGAGVAVDVALFVRR